MRILLKLLQKQLFYKISNKETMGSITRKYVISFQYRHENIKTIKLLRYHDIYALSFWRAKLGRTKEARWMSWL
jgi:hypothetical protein